MRAPHIALEPEWGDAQSEVVRLLSEYGRELAEAGAAQFGDAFSTHPEADAFVRSRPEAFLVGVLFTQGIPAERAWAGPYLLNERLGHFDLERLAAEPDAVRSAVQRRPMLHRFKETLPGWISAAARRVLDDYGGDAALIWAPGSSVSDVSRRLARFEGIGRKKAAMAAELLVRHFGVPLSGLERGEVAYDVHVRRVFLRTGLVTKDSPEAVAAASRRACPEAPGMLDLPTWLIGRDTCRPRSPRCDACRLGEVCPRLTHLSPVGVGARKR